MLNWQWVLSDILGENSIKKRRSNSFQKAFERRLCFDWIAGVTGIFERISFLLQKSHFVFHDHRISFCGIYKTIRKAFSRLFFYRIYTLMQVGWFYNLPFRWPGKPAKTSSRQVLLELRPLIEDHYAFYTLN